MKSPRTIMAEGCLYVAIAAGQPIIEFLVSDRPLTSRSCAAVLVMAIVAGANSLKAFFSTSMSDSQKPQPTEVVAPPGEPLQVETHDR